METTLASKLNIINSYKENSHLYKSFLPLNKPIYNPDVYSRDTDTLQIALEKLNTLTFNQKDIKKIQRYGARQIYKNGKEAVNFAKKNNIEIRFDNVDAEDIHAQWIAGKNAIIINKKYKNTKSMADVYAISAAILHELSHAKDKDSISSIQEEIDCLGMNALAFNVFKTNNPRLFKNATSPIINNGVGLYSNLFLGANKTALQKRIKEKYGNLPLESPNHKATDFAKEIAII